MPSEVLKRANELLDREDRRLDRLLTELATSRATLEREQRDLKQLRVESETARDEYRSKLERLQERRDVLFHAMRRDLDRAFSDAHGQVAAVIRDLQRQGSAQAAAHARTRLQSLETRAERAQKAAGIAQPKPPPSERFEAVDWRHAKPGDSILVPGGKVGSLETLPDRRGRVSVRVGGTKFVLPADRVGRPDAAAGTRAPDPAPVAVPAGLAFGTAGGTLHCDLRGLRVDEAIDRVTESLDRAAAEGRDGIEFVHGSGTGALRKAVREHLGDSPYVVKIRTAERERGDGVTVALLRDE